MEQSKLFADTELQELIPEKIVGIEDGIDEDLEYIMPHPDEADPKEDWIIPGFSQGMVALLIGSGGTGKSSLAMELGMSVSVGDNFFDGMPISQKGSVRLLFLEDSANIVQTRNNRIARYFRKHNFAIPDNSFLYASHSLVGTNLYLMDSRGNHIADNIEKLTRYCKDKRLVVIDPLKKLHNFDENSSSMADELMGILQNIALETNCGMLIVHHVSKNATRNKQDHLQDAVRGSSAFNDAARLVLNLRQYNETDANKLELIWSKHNYIGARKPVKLLRTEEGVIIPDYDGKTTKTDKRNRQRTTKVYAEI